MDAINLSQNDFLDVLFDNRNKDYGAYSLRRHYERRMRNAIGITAAILLTMIAVYTVSNIIAKDHPVIPLASKDPLVLKPIDIPIDQPKPVQPPPPAVSTPAASKPTIKDVKPAIVPDNTPDVTPPPRQDEMNNKVIGAVNTTGDPNGSEFDTPPNLGGTGIGVVHVASSSHEGDNEHPVTFVEVMPSFPGGEDALAKFLKNNVRYPSMAQENGIQGVVSVQFVVTTDGTIQGVKVVGATHGGGLEDEAMRVVKKMPKWKPGKQNGREVAVYFTLPIRFIMQDQ